MSKECDFSCLLRMELVCDQAELGLFPAVYSSETPSEIVETRVRVPPAEHLVVEAETAGVFQSLQTYCDGHSHLLCSEQRAHQNQAHSD